MEEDNQNNIQDFTPEDSITNTPIEPEQPLTPKPRKKLNKTTTIATLAIILGLAGIGFGVYSLINSKNTPNAPAIENKEEMAESEKQNLNLPVIIDDKDCAGDSCKEYTYQNRGLYDLLCVNYIGIENNNTLKIDVLYNKYTDESNKELNKYCYSEDKTGEQSFIVDNFDSKISAVEVFALGQGVVYDTAFILMEDGNVEYIPLAYAVKNNEIRSYGKIAGVENVVRFIMAESRPKDDPVGGGITVLGQRDDGKFYDLGHLVQLNKDYYNF